MTFPVSDKQEYLCDPAPEKSVTNGRSLALGTQNSFGVSLDMCDDETACSYAMWLISLKLDFAFQVTFMWLKILKLCYISDVA